MRNCGNCAEGRKHGIGKQVYCGFYGIIINANYDRCARQKPRIIEVENEVDRRSGEKTVRREGS